MLKSLIDKNILFDSHCHLNDSSFDADRDAVVQNAIHNETEKIFDIGINFESSKNAIENSIKYPNTIASIGIDMETLIPGSDIFEISTESVFEQFGQLENLLVQNKNHVGMIGETGVDNYWLQQQNATLSSKRILDSLELQKLLFKMHIKLAQKYSLPLTIHSREATDICLQILDHEDYANGVFHSLTPHKNMDENDYYNLSMTILERGIYIGVNGIVTFKNAHTIRNTYMKILQERTGKSSNFEVSDWYSSGFVFETDSPFLAPEGMRGTRNEPKNIASIVQFFNRN